MFGAPGQLPSVGPTSMAGLCTHATHLPGQSRQLPRVLTSCLQHSLDDRLPAVPLPCPSASGPCCSPSLLLQPSLPCCHSCDCHGYRMLCCCQIEWILLHFPDLNSFSLMHLPLPLLFTQPPNADVPEGLVLGPWRPGRSTAQLSL